MNVLLGLKELAVNPSYSISSCESVSQLCDQILEFRIALSLSATGTPLRKRKHERINRDRINTTPGFSADMFDPKHLSKTSGGELSESFLLGSIDSVNNLFHHHLPVSQNSGSLLTHEDNDQEKQVLVKFLPMDHSRDPDFINRPFCLPMDSDESANGSDTLNTCIEKLNRKKSCSMEIEESVISSASTCLENGGGRRPRRVIQPIGGCPSVPLKVVPIGPRFQVEIPPWNNSDQTHDSCETRWLGTLVWPVNSYATKNAKKYIGQGIQDSRCCCSSPGSMHCVRVHTLDEAKALECELGEAFLSWRFDEMGDSVLRFWTPKEQRRLIWFLKTSDGSNEKSFWNRVLRAFPSKSKENILRYYFGVFIPHMNMMARSSGKHVDSDGDEVDDMGVSKGKYKVQYSKYLMNHHICLPG